MFDGGFEEIETSGDDPDLAALFCGQLRVLSHPLPSHVAISELGDKVLCVLSWSPSPGFGLSGVVIVALREVTEAHLHRRVDEARVEDLPGFSGAVLHFHLDGATEGADERAEALRRWVRQATRIAEERTHVSFSRAVEAADLRARSRIIRGEARRARRRHAAVL